MNAPTHPKEAQFTRFARSVSLGNPTFVLALFVGLIAVQALGFLVFGTGRSGKSISGLVLTVHNLLAFACAWIAFRRARGVAAIFWFLYAVSMLTLLIPTVFGTYDTLFDRSTLSPST